MTESQRLDQVTAIILAGGKGSRMNYRNKGLLKIDQTPMIELVVNKIKPSLNHIIISANQDLDSYGHYNLPVIQDKHADFQGPLAGLLSCKSQIQTPLTLVIPVDGPGFPKIYPQIMYQSYLEQRDICVAHDGIQPQFLFMLFESKLIDDMDEYFKQGHRSVKGWLRRHNTHFVYFRNNPTAFLNINTPEDIDLLKKDIPS